MFLLAHEWSSHSLQIKAKHLHILHFVTKVCVLDLVQLEDDIGYFKSSHTDLFSSKSTRSKTQTLPLDTTTVE